MQAKIGCHDIDDVSRVHRFQMCVHVRVPRQSIKISKITYIWGGQSNLECPYLFSVCETLRLKTSFSLVNLILLLVVRTVKIYWDILVKTLLNELSHRVRSQLIVKCK